MELDLNVLRPQERASLQLRLLYEQEGFRKYHMGRFEEYGLYQENRRFLSSEQVITFTDLDGRLLALKPDVTLSIAKNAQVGPGGCGRYYYQENVYRPSQESHTFREISQMGLECIGAVDDAAAAQVVSLALRSLALTGRDAALEVSHMGFVTGLFDAVGAPESIRPRLLTCIRDKNVHELRKAAEAAGLSRQGTDALCRLGTLAGPWQEVLAAAEVLALNPDGVFLSNGPGDPEAVEGTYSQVEKLLGKVPVFGICLGHQMMGKAAGAGIEKLKYGHRGGNHPVMNLRTGRVEITAQNHGFDILFPSLGPLVPELSGGFKGHEDDLRFWARAGIAPVVDNARFGRIQLTHVNLNDGTAEGVAFLDIPAFSVQYHPEASPGPTDAHYLFTAFSRLMDGRDDFLDIDIAQDRLAGWKFGEVA